GAKLRRRGRQATLRRGDDAHRVLDGDELAAVALGAAEARKDDRLPPGHEVRAVELGRNVGGETRLPERPRRDLEVGRRREEVRVHREEDVRPTLRHGADRADGVEAVAAGRLEAEGVAELAEELRLGPFPDADRAVALDVRVTADRAGPRPRLAD